MILHKPKHALACQSCQCFGWKRGKNKVQMPGVIWEKEVMDCSFNIILIAVIMVIYVGNYDFWDMYFAYQIVILLTEIKTCTVVTKQIWKYWLFLPGHEICRWLLWAQQITEEVIIHCSSFAAITAAHLSGIVSKYILRNSTLMLSHAFCNSSQRLSFECTINLSSLFSKLPQICSRGWGVDFEGSIIFNVPADSFYCR